MPHGMMFQDSVLGPNGQQASVMDEMQRGRAWLCSQPSQDELIISVSQHTNIIRVCPFGAICDPSSGWPAGSYIIPEEEHKFAEYRSLEPKMKSAP